jgi:hypothetical protein
VIDFIKEIFLSKRLDLLPKAAIIVL